jgi:hypothetical protein
VAEAPSPYAPGIISDERSPPRPPARPAVFLLATFVTGALMAALMEMRRSRPSVEDGGSGRFDLFPVLMTAPALLTLLLAYLTDRLALWGARREGYLMLSVLVMAALWMAIAATQDHPMAWSAVAVPFGLASVLAHATVVGALAEIGRRRAATGWLAASNVGLANLGSFAAPWAMTGLAVTSIWAVAGAAMGLALALVLLIVTLSDDDAPATGSMPGTGVGIPTFLRSRAFWALLPVLICSGIATVPQTTLISLHRAALAPSADIGEMQAWLGTGTAIAVPAAYALLSRRVRFRHLLRFALLVQALVLLACGRLLGSSESRTIDLAALLLTISDGLSGIATLDLALRAAPPGREAFGSMLLLAVGSVSRGIANVAAIPLAGLEAAPVAQSAMSIAWFAAGAAIIGVFAVALLPRAIAGTSDGQVLGSPP